jgi:hypothetical protein
MCGDCYGTRANIVDEMCIHDWLIFIVDFGGAPECRIAIHKSIATPNSRTHADRSSPDPDDDISRFGPGTCTMSLQAIDDLHADVNLVDTLVDEGYIDGKKAHLIFQAPDLLTQLESMALVVGRMLTDAGGPTAATGGWGENSYYGGVEERLQEATEAIIKAKDGESKADWEYRYNHWKNKAKGGE